MGAENLTPPGFHPRTVQSVASRYTDCAVPAVVNKTSVTSVLAMGNLRDLHYELLEHPPYSTDLAPSDFCLFPKLKLFLAAQRFSSNQKAIAAVEGILQILRRTTTGTG